MHLVHDKLVGTAPQPLAADSLGQANQPAWRVTVVRPVCLLMTPLFDTTLFMHWGWCVQKPSRKQRLRPS